jgi:hypothetical protein
MMTLRILTTVCGLYATVVLSGCSIGMALSGNKQPNFDYIVVGAPRNHVEAELGHPAATNELTEGKQEVTYKYEMGNSPNTGRAWMYGYAWLTLIGILGEPIYSLIELNMGHDEETRIVYGPDNKILEIRGYTPSPISKVVIEAQESQEKFIERRQKFSSAPAEQSSSPPDQ